MTLLVTRKTQSHNQQGFQGVSSDTVSGGYDDRVVRSFYDTSLEKCCVSYCPLVLILNSIDIIYYYIKPLILLIKKEYVFECVLDKRWIGDTCPLFHDTFYFFIFQGNAIILNYRLSYCPVEFEIVVVIDPLIMMLKKISHRPGATKSIETTIKLYVFDT